MPEDRSASAGRSGEPDGVCGAPAGSPKPTSTEGGAKRVYESLTSRGSGRSGCSTLLIWYDFSTSHRDVSRRAATGPVPSARTTASSTAELPPKALTMSFVLAAGPLAGLLGGQDPSRSSCAEFQRRQLRGSAAKAAP